MKSLRRLAPSLGLAVLLAACGSTETNEGCLFAHLVDITAPNVMSVGDTVTFQASLVPGGCLPAGLEPADWRWSSSDTLIARIDSLTGLAQGIGGGTATISVQHASAPRVQQITQLQVVAGAGR